MWVPLFKLFGTIPFWYESHRAKFIHREHLCVGKWRDGEHQKGPSDTELGHLFSFFPSSPGLPICLVVWEGRSIKHLWFIIWVYSQNMWKWQYGRGPWLKSALSVNVCIPEASQSCWMMALWLLEVSMWPLVNQNGKKKVWLWIINL